MSQIGNDPNAVADALQGRAPAPGAAQPGQMPGAQQGGLAQLAQAYARCEQTKSCTPQDLAILKQGLPNLMQMVKDIQQIIQMTSQGGGQQPTPNGS